MTDLKKQLRKISDDNFQEINESSVRGTPNQWNKRAHRLFLTLEDLKINTCLSIHQGFTSSIKTCRTQLASSYTISATVNEYSSHDSIHFAEQDAADKSLYTLELPRDGIEIELSVGEPIIGNPKYSEGVYFGNCFRNNYVYDTDIVHINVCLPSNQLDEIVKSIRLDPNVQVVVSVVIPSFTSDLDDMFFKPGNSRNLFIEKDAQVILESVRLASDFSPSLNDESIERLPVIDELQSQINALNDQVELLKLNRETTILSIYRDIQNSVHKMAIALWAIAGTVIGGLIFRS